MTADNRPLIAVVPLWDEERASYWMLPGYMDAVLAAGGFPLMPPLLTSGADVQASMKLFDGFLLTGGQDVAPGFYGEAVREACGETCPMRDTMEAELVRLAIEADKPLFGICRGIQFLNAALGGTLIQDIPTELASDLVHSQEPPYDVPAHPVTLSGYLKDLLGTRTLEVNSSHHQGIEKLAPGLTACAQAPDGLIEAVHLPGRKFVLAAQWHPECAPDWPSSRTLFQTFVDACR